MIVRERQSTTTLDLPAMCRMSVVYSKMYESWRCWRDHGSATLDMQNVSGLWSTKAANSRPSRRNRKWRIATSESKEFPVERAVFALPGGQLATSTLTAKSDVSVVMAKGALCDGWAT